MLASDNGLPLVAVATAAVLTGSGGGMVRDVLAGRKPVIFRDEIYALWALLAGLMIGLGLLTSSDLEKLTAQLAKLTNEDVVVLSGSVPPTLEPTIYQMWDR